MTNVGEILLELTGIICHNRDKSVFFYLDMSSC